MENSKYMLTNMFYLSNTFVWGIQKVPDKIFYWNLSQIDLPLNLISDRAR